MATVKSKKKNAPADYIDVLLPQWSLGIIPNVAQKMVNAVFCI